MIKKILSAAFIAISVIGSAQQLTNSGFET
jgi:hypothetical protein